MTGRCGVAALLGEGGPVRVAMRPCCLLALVGGRPPTASALPSGSLVCRATAEASAGPRASAAALLLPVGDGEVPT